MDGALSKMTALLGQATACAVVFSVCHEIGYFSVVGSYFQTLFSPSDYLNNTFIWIPTSVQIVVYIYAIWFLMERSINGSKEWFFFWVAVPPFMFSVGLWLFLGINPLSAALVFLAYVLAWSLPRIIDPRKSDLSLNQWKMIIIFVCTCIVTLNYGADHAKSDMKSVHGTYIIKTKNSNESRPAMILRGLSGGLLVKDVIGDRVSYIKSEEIISISKNVDLTNKKSLSCLMFEIFCPEGWN